LSGNVPTITTTFAEMPAPGPATPTQPQSEHTTPARLRRVRLTGPGANPTTPTVRPATEPAASVHAPTRHAWVRTLPGWCRAGRCRAGWCRPGSLHHSQPNLSARPYTPHRSHLYTVSYKQLCTNLYKPLREHQHTHGVTPSPHRPSQHQKTGSDLH